MSIDKAIEILESRKAPETEQDFDDFDSALETAINLLKTHPDNQPNDPLTMEQLREMDGESVYLYFIDGGEWVLLRKYEGKVFITHRNTICSPVNLVFKCGGKIYRRKPEEGK